MILDETPEIPLVLNPSVTLDDIEAATLGLGSELIEVFRPPEAPFYERVYETDGGLLIRLIDDDFVQITLLTIEAGDGAEQLAEAFLAALPGFTVDDLRRIFHEHTDAVRKFALRGLAAANNGPMVQPLFDEVVAAARDTDADLRYTALVCMGRLGWEQFRSIAKDMAANDKDPEVRERATSLVESIREVHGPDDGS